MTDPIEEFLDELANTRWDIPRFGRLLGVEVHAGQERFYDSLMMRDETGVRPLYLTLALSSGNRAGKTLGLAIAILHSMVHKLGLPAPGNATKAIDQWVKHPYHWYHFGIQQEVADLVFHELVMLLDGTHPAQKGRGCPFTDVLGRKVIKTGVKERGDYRWVVLDPVLGSGELHFRTTNEKAIGQLGKDMHGISYDECGFDNNLVFVVNEVLHMRRLSTAGQLILISTPSESFQQFADEWERGNPDNPEREPGHYSVRMSTRENVGYGIEEDYFNRIVASMPKHLIPQNVDGQFIEGRNAFFNAQAVEACFLKEMEVEVAPADGHAYVQGVDPALTHDATWSITLDFTVEDYILGVSARRREGKQSLPNLITMITVQHTVYNAGKARCLTAIDSSGMGGKVFRDALQDLHPLRCVEFGGVKSRKLKLLTDLKGYIEKGWLKFPKAGVWLEVRKQLLAYRQDDKNLRTDAVMALAVCVRQLVQAASMTDWDESIPFDMYDEGQRTQVPKTYEHQRFDYSDRRATGMLGARLKRGAKVTVGEWH